MICHQSLGVLFQYKEPLSYSELQQFKVTSGLNRVSNFIHA